MQPPPEDEEGEADSAGTVGEEVGAFWGTLTSSVEDILNGLEEPQALEAPPPAAGDTEATSIQGLLTDIESDRIAREASQRNREAIKGMLGGFERMSQRMQAWP